MKPHTVYEKAVQDFTQIARLQATLNQHFRQASFAEFELMGLDDEVFEAIQIAEADTRAGAHRSVSNCRAQSGEITVRLNANGEIVSYCGLGCT
jgi:hypothetical protein